MKGKSRGIRVAFVSFCCAFMPLGGQLCAGLRFGEARALDESFGLAGGALSGKEPVVSDWRRRIAWWSIGFFQLLAGLRRMRADFRILLCRAPGRRASGGWVAVDADGRCIARRGIR